MSSGAYSRRLPVLATIVVALMLSIIPLPGWLEPFRPDWVVLTLIYWSMMLPRSWSVGSAWIVGLVLDVAQGTLLGQHALALCVVVFVTVRMHLLMRVFPAGQLVASVFSLLALYQFIVFWINGVAGVPVEAMHYWGPVVSGTLVWPLVSSVLNGIRIRVQ
jgi:rod shape-determining protein MreD